MISEGSRDTEDWRVMMLKIQRCHHQNKLYFLIYLNRKKLFEMVIIFQNIPDVIVFFYEKYSHGEHKIFK